MTLSRYEDLFNMKSSKRNVPTFTISKRDSDIYLNYLNGDRLDLMSYRVYGEPQYWWIILAANDYSLEFDIEFGEILRVPYPLSEVISEIKEQIK